MGRRRDQINIHAYVLEGGNRPVLFEDTVGAEHAAPGRLLGAAVWHEHADKDILSFEGFWAPWWKQLLYYLLGLCTAGFAFLFAKWMPKVQVALQYTKCRLKDATFVRITLVDGRSSVHKVDVVHLADHGQMGNPYLPESNTATLLEQAGWGTTQRLLEFRCHRYFFLDSHDTFVPVPDVPRGFTSQLQKSASAMAATSAQGAAAGRGAVATEAAITSVLDDHEWDVADRQLRYGANEMRIPVKSIAALVADEMWHPFYVFQYFSILVWVAGDQYYTYAVCIFVITWFSIITGAVETHQNMKRLAQVAQFACKVQVLRNGTFLLADSADLVPGDVVVVQNGTLPADMALLRGECIVDENMLTGESVPVRKVPYSPAAEGVSYDPDKHAGCTLYGGTCVAQARGGPGQAALAMVVRTRFYSAKGQLLRSILFPREHSESFISDSLKFIGVMLLACIGLFIWAAVVLASVGAHRWRIVVRFFDMVTIAVPPALPACLTIATVFSIGRLRKRSIYVTGPHTITTAGQLDVVCFDKTGTLTEQGLELQAIVPVTSGAFGAASKHMEQLPALLPQLLASCHGLARMGEVLVGDPLDQKLFAATGWSLVDGHSQQQGSGEAVVSAHSWVHPPGRPDQRSLVVRRFEFSSALQRNLVVLKVPGSSSSSLAPGGSSSSSNLASTGSGGSPRAGGGKDGAAAAAAAGAGGAVHALYLKGSPEMIRTLVTKESIPDDFDQILGEYTREGLRVIALAAGSIPPGSLPAGALHDYSQAQFEGAVPLSLVGLAVLANPLRPDTAGVIGTLQKAQIRCAMVTGDHLRTAISVAHQCSILPSARPVLLLDAAPPGQGIAAAAVAGVPPSLSGVKLSVLYPDGSVNESVPRSTVIPQVLTGELECAVTGKGFDALVASGEPDLMVPVLQRAAVFARMTPDNKRDLMELLGNGLEGAPASLPHLSLYVGFCGDGANDCGALKAAHVGVSLCEAEASVAAPMTSRHQSIASMLVVVAEGRCALMATCQIFQFIVGYAMAQAFSTNLMYTYALQMGNYQYLIQDLFYITILAAFMGYTHPRQELSRQKPLGRVLSPPVLLSTTLQLAVIIVFQTASLRALYRVPWYTRSLGTPDLRTIVAPETTTIYLMGLAQFLILALVFNKGHPHRMPLWTNLGLTLALVCQLGFLIYSTFAVDAFTTKVQQLVGFGPPLGLPVSFRGVLVLIFVLNAGAALGAEALCQLILMAVGGLRSKYGWFGGKKQQQQYAFSSSGSELPLPPPIESMGSGVPLRTPHALDGSNGGAYAGSTGGQASRRGVNGAAAAATGAAPQHNTALL